MSTIAIDTTRRELALVLRLEGDGSVQSVQRLGGRNLDTHLVPALQACDDGAVERVVVITGPGSYTGVRAGMAAALGLASARRLPLHGCSLLEAVAAAAPPEAGKAFTVAADAGRGRFDTAPVRRTGGGISVAEGKRREASTLGGGAAVVATAPVPGVATVVVDPVAVLRAAALLALVRPPLDPVGLAAIVAGADPVMNAGL